MKIPALIGSELSKTAKLNTAKATNPIPIKSFVLDIFIKKP